MKCPECGSEVAGDEKFCGNCGAPVEGGAPTSETVAEIPAVNETVVAEAPAIAPLEPEDAPPLTSSDYEAPPAPPPAPPAQKDNRKLIWIIVAVVAVLLLCCCCIVALVFVFSEDLAYMVEDLAMLAPQLLSVV